MRKRLAELQDENREIRKRREREEAKLVEDLPPGHRQLLSRGQRRFGAPGMPRSLLFQQTMAIPKERRRK